MGIDSNTFCFSEIKIVHTLPEVTYALGPMTLDFMKFNKIIHVYKKCKHLDRRVTNQTQMNNNNTDVPDYNQIPIRLR